MNTMDGITSTPRVYWNMGLDVIDGESVAVCTFTFVESKDDPTSNESFYVFKKEELEEFVKYIHNGTEFFRVGSNRVPIFLEVFTTPLNGYKINVNGYFKINVDRIDFQALVDSALEHM